MGEWIVFVAMENNDFFLLYGNESDQFMQLSEDEVSALHVKVYRRL